MPELNNPSSYRLTGPMGYRSRLSNVGKSAPKNISRRSGKIPAFILDLDQTIWDTTEEAKAIEEDLIFNVKKQKGFLTASDWDSWTRAAAEVDPIPEMVEFVRGLERSGITPVIMTARDEANRGMIQSTLKSYGIKADHLMLRGLSDAQQSLSSDVLKRGMMEETVGRFNFLAMLDDSASNLKAAYRFGVPLGMQPLKEGFDSIESSVARGLEIASSIGQVTGKKAARAVEPIVSAGASTGVMSSSTLRKIIQSGETAAKVMRGII